MQEIEWNRANSSNIEKWRYDPETRVLEILFVGGDGSYSYDDVPLEVATGFSTAHSVGQYFHQNIKGRYRFYRG